MSNMIFPPSPAIGDSYTASNGITYTWDGQAWTAQSGIHTYWTDNAGDNTLAPSQASRSITLAPGAALIFGGPSTDMSVESESPNYLCVHSPDTIELEAGGNTALLARASEVDVLMPLLLAADPVQPLEAATKEYVDAAIANMTDAGIWAVDSGTIFPAEPFGNPYSVGQSLALLNPAQPWNGQTIYFGDPRAGNVSYFVMQQRAFALVLQDGATQFYVSNYTGGTASELDIPANSTFDIRIGGQLAARTFATAFVLPASLIFADTFQPPGQAGAMRYHQGHFQGYGPSGWLNLDDQPIPAAPPTIIAATPPLTPIVGQLWWRNTDGALFIFYDDGTSQQWVPVVTT